MLPKGLSPAAICAATGREGQARCHRAGHSAAAAAMSARRALLALGTRRAANLGQGPSVCLHARGSCAGRWRSLAAKPPLSCELCSWTAGAQPHGWYVGYWSALVIGCCGHCAKIGCARAWSHVVVNHSKYQTSVAPGGDVCHGPRGAGMRPGPAGGWTAAYVRPHAPPHLDLRPVGVRDRIRLEEPVRTWGRVSAVRFRRHGPHG